MVPFLVKKGFLGAVFGVFRLPDKQDVSGKGAKQDGGRSELPIRGDRFNKLHTGTC